MVSPDEKQASFQVCACAQLCVTVHTTSDEQLCGELGRKPMGLASFPCRPFPPPVYNCLPYAKTKGEGLGDLVTCR